MKETYEVVVVGGGVAGCFAAATAATEGTDVVQLERKSSERSGYIACGDAMKAPEEPKMYPGPIDMDQIIADDAVLIDGSIDQIEWWDEELDVRKVLRYENASNVIDRYEFGQHLLEQVSDLGVDQHYDTVITDVIQNGSVSGVTGIRQGEPVRYEAEVVIDAAGAQSLLQDLIDFDALDGNRTFEMPHYTHFGSAYREIVETDEPVEYHNAIVGKPLEEFGYIWYFPRTPTVINVGLGYQMSKDPVPLADRLKRDMEQRPEFQNATLNEKFGKKNKLGSSIALRRALDSMVAPGYLATGGAAGTTHPISGKGIRGAAISGYSAGKTAARALADGDVSQHGLWEHNHYLFVEHGECGKMASRDAYNMAGDTIDVDVLRAVTALLPADKLSEIVGTEKQITDLGSKMMLGVGIFTNLVSAYRSGTFDKLGVSKDQLVEAGTVVQTTRNYVDRYVEQYEAYPADRDGFEEWLSRRNRLDEEFYDAIGIDPANQKY